MENILQLFLNGISVGSIYSLLSMGLTLVFGILEIVNFSHGSFIMLSLYTTYLFYNFFGIDPYISIIIVAPLFFLFGAILEKTIIKKLIGASAFNQIFATFGIGLIITGAIFVVFSGNFYNVLPKYLFKNVSFLGLTLTVPYLIAIFINLGTVLLLFLFLHRTYIGEAIRALSQQRIGAEIVGINVSSLYVISFGIGILLSSIAASTLAPLSSINPNIGDHITLVIFVVVVLGGYNSLVGTFIGGLLFGLLEVFSGYYLSSQLKELVCFSLFILVLVIKPTGLFGSREAKE